MKTAEDYLGEEVTEAVITVPAYFNDASARRPRTPAGSPAWTVKRIINEPTAAALAFGLDKDRSKTARSPSSTSAAAPSTSRSSRSRRRRRELRGALDQRRHLPRRRGLRPAHHRLLAAEFKKEGRRPRQRTRSALQRLKEAAEKAKIELSSVARDRGQPAVITADAAVRAPER